MSSFGAKHYSPRTQHVHSRPHNNNEQRGPEQMEMYNKNPYYSQHGGYQGGRGITNQGYHGSSIDDINVAHRRSHQTNNGVTNRGYIASTSSDEGFYSPTEGSRRGNIAIPSITGGMNGHDTSRYKTNDISDTKDDIQKKGICQSRKCRCITAVIILLLLAGAAVVVGLYFGTDLLGNKDGPKTTETTTVIAVGSSLVTQPSSTAGSNNTTVTINYTESSTKGPTTTTTAMLTTTTVIVLPDGDTFSGELRLNQTWVPELSDTSSEAFQNKSREFSSYMDKEMSSSQLLGSSYNSTQVVSLSSGSIKVRFIMKFNSPVVRDQVVEEIDKIAESSGSTMDIISGSASLEDFLEETACGADDLLLCNGVCKKKSEIACDSFNDCVDWYDEFNCPGDSITCDFESSRTCGYFVHENNQHGYKWIYNSGDTSSPGTGPPHDHTYQNESGHYYYTEWCNSCKHADVALLTSPWYVTRQPSCLSFYFHMVGHPTEMGSLYLSAYDMYDAEKLLWTRENPVDADDKEGNWQQVKVDIPAGSYRFIFSSMFNSGSDLGDKAIDDILIEDGACSDLPVCNGTLYCSITNECLSPTDKPLCNGRFECPDGSDEQNCPDSVYSVSFESGNDLSTYSLTNITTNPIYQWVITKSSTPIVGTYFDHTYKNSLGHYITVLPGSLSQTPSGTESRLIIGKTLSDNQERCLRFTFNMNYEGSVSDTSGTIKVLARDTSTGVAMELWNNTQKTGRDWIPASYSLQALANSYQIEFVATRLGGDGIVISLDDITIMNGFCTCDDASRRQCPDRTCIPEEWFCDGDQDCANGEDEVNCPVCPIDQHTCRDRSCVPGGESIKCDGNYDCADGSDEHACAYVDQCATEDCVKLAHPEGYLAVCSDDWDTQLDSQICRYLYKSSSGSSTAPTAASSSATQFLHLTKPSSQGFMSKFTKVSSCPGNLVIKVDCKEETCGKRAPSLSPYIIGGEETTEQGRWPWQVDLRLRGAHYCGATLLNPHWVITAAHCVKSGAPRLWTVILGSTSSFPGQEKSIELKVKRIIIQPDYINVFGGDDIALLFIEEAIGYTNEIQPACLPDVDDIYNTRSRCFITGWGRIQPEAVYPEVLQEAKYKLTSRSSCSAAWASRLQLRDSMQCAGYSSGTIRTCRGDSGGPLVCLDKYKRWTLVGITSLGPRGCLFEVHKDDIFTKVTSYLPWVQDIINFQFNCTNGKVLLDRDMLCDAVDNCGDNSDEVLPCTLSVECDFESRNLCGYVTGEHWKNITGSASHTGSLDNTGPSYDHTTGLADGVATYMATSVDGAVLTTPFHNSTDTSCLRFFYYLSYSSKIEVLAETAPLANIGEAANTWQFAQVSMPAGEYTLKFKANIPQPSYIAIDDVTVSEGPCSDSCPFEMFKCGSQCIANKYKCDGVSHCIDSSDETSCANSPDTIECSFDEPFACGIQQTTDDDFNIMVRYNNLMEGPSDGHRDDEDERDVSYLLAVAPKSHQKSTIVWPVYVRRHSCMTFWYYMNGENVGSLEVVSDGVRLWQEFGSHGTRWLRGRVTIQTGKTVEIRAQAGQQNANYIAVDDFSVTAGDCPAPPSCDPVSEFSCSGKCINASRKCDKTADCYDASDEASCEWSVDCDFTSDCAGYSLSSFLPSYTWTRNNAGYLTADPVNTEKGAKALFTSAPFTATGTQCVTFRYLMAGRKTGNPELRVSIREQTISRETVIWRMSQNHTAWRTGRAEFVADHNAVSLIFEAVYGGNKAVSLSLDDILLVPGPCSQQDCADQFLCPYEDTCIAASARCDGIYDCQGGVDERDCGDLAKLMDCNFDDDYCQWTNSTDSLLLARHAGSTALVDTGPTYDHTQNNLAGFYLYMKSKVFPGDARLTSPTVRLQKDHCLTFFYHMNGRNIGYLNVSNAAAPTESPLLSIFGAHSVSEWHIAKVNIPPTEALALQFLFTSEGLLSNTAVDDITFREGTCDCSNDHQCGTSGLCFDKKAKCDNIQHCPDSSDEIGCGCPDNDIYCAVEDACLPTFIICEFQRNDCLFDGQVIDCGCNSTFQRSCDQGFCYDEFAHCNGFPDCPDESDEKPRCGENCPPGFLACADKSKCIHEAEWCNGQADCADASDEDPSCVRQVSKTTVRPACRLTADWSVTISSQYVHTCGYCSSSNFICHDKSQVISRTKYCDGQVDCDDSSDEPLRCECCADSQFTCASGDLCIPVLSRCDGSYDCPDFSDEISCNCTAEHFQCDAGLCLSKSKRCDGKFNCNDLTDEVSCDCSSSQFQCNNGLCVDNTMKCNGRDDCLDNSDEFDCPCSNAEVKCEAATDKRCIPSEWKCDGYEDCEGATDEAGCTNCTEFMCTDYSCIPFRHVCDGVSHCTDGKDEQSCFGQEKSSLVTVQISNGVALESHKVCYDGWSADWSSLLCTQLGYDHVVSTRVLSTDQLSGSWVKLNYSQGYQSLMDIERVPTCASNYALALECQAKACGEGKQANIASYIIGGNLVHQDSDWPWMMPIYYGGELAGSGVHIGNGWIITAGHLARVLRIKNGARHVERRDEIPHLFKVETTSLSRNQSGNLLSVNRVIVHPQFTIMPTLRHDIALLQVKAGLEYPSICWKGSSPVQSTNNKLCYVAGWGSVNGQDKAVLHLRDARVTILPDLECVRKWNSGGFSIFYPSTMACAGSASLPSTCFGDSGGPLMCLNPQSSTWTLSGIVSFGDTNCLLQEKPNVFTQMAAYEDWVKQVIT